MNHCIRGQEREYAELLQKTFCNNKNPIFSYFEKVSNKPKILGKIISYSIKFSDYTVYLKFLGTEYDYIPIIIIPYEDEGFILMQFTIKGYNFNWSIIEFTPHYVDRFVERHCNDYTNFDELSLYTTISLEYLSSYKEFSDSVFIAFARTGVSLGYALDNTTWVKLNTYIAEEDLFRDQQNVFNNIIKECNITFPYFDIAIKNSENFKKFIKRSGLYIESGTKLNYKFKKEIFEE